MAVEAALLVGVYTAYSFVRNELGSAMVPFATAARHARQVLRLQEFVGIDIELGLHNLVNHHAEPLARFAIFYYRAAHQWAVIATLVWLFLRRAHVYPRLRTALLATTVLALVGFWLYPLAPPRLLPELGFVDTVRLPATRWASPPDPSRWAFSGMETNQFAAMPSLHVAWPVWIVAATWIAGAGRRGRALALVHLALTSFAVVVTANHWVLDGVAGAALVGIALALVRPRRAQPPPSSSPPSPASAPAASRP